MLPRPTWPLAALLLAAPGPALAQETAAAPAPAPEQPAAAATAPAATAAAETAAAETAAAETAMATAPESVEDLKKRLAEVERRLAQLETPAAAQAADAKESLSESARRILRRLELGGILSASYTYNFNQPESGLNVGRGYDAFHNQPMFNKALLKLALPVEYDAAEWRAGFALKLLFGQDAYFTQTSPMGDFGDVFEATATLNVPLGRGLKLTVGKYATAIGYESPFLEEAANWSGGLPWTYLEPFVHTGFALKYAFSSAWEAELMFNNGWDLMQDNNHAKSGILHVTFTPREGSTFSLLGYAGPEQEADDDHWRFGGNFYLEHRWVPQFKTALQLDYGAEQFAGREEGAGDFLAQWFGASLWLIMQPAETYGLALRADFVRDTHGVRTSGAPRLAPMPANAGMNLFSATLTFNLYPVSGFRIAPELRWDYSTLPGGAFEGRESQLTLALGMAYLF